jgi:ESX secretion system protein EccD
VPRLVAAPCFLGAAAFAWAWDPVPERLPMVVGVTAAAVAVGAAIARAAAGQGEAQLGVLVVAGSGVFAVTGALTLLGWSPRAAWAVLLAAALLAARFVPLLAVDVPDQYLVDVERLAVTAWSARDPVPRRRVRSIVPIGAVATVADRGGRVLGTAAGVVLALVLVSAPLLLWTATLPVDRVGARLEVALVGIGLLLAARSYRHPVARSLLRLAGLACGGALTAYAVPRLGDGQLLAVSLSAVGLGLLLVVAAMATGRGWRSGWWSRRAEVAEALCGSSALAVVLVASGVFRHLWELTS